MNPDLSQLHPYPFQKLAELLSKRHPPHDREHIALSIGEPKHGTPAIIQEALRTHLHGLAKYPMTRGGETLRHSIAQWLKRRFGLPESSIDPDRNVLPVNGSREALFSFAQCVIDRNKQPLVLMPNPFYQIYEGAALLAGAQAHYINCTKTCAYKPDFDAVTAQIWNRCQLLYLCTPGNPTGAVLDEPELQRLIDLADRHDFVIASDECYSEIYFHENQPPAGLLGAAARMGNSDYERCVAFNSLSKRSNAPGLRSGFVAGDANIISRYLHYRTYHGCAMPYPTQAASEAAWRDETHVHENRRLYREKFDAVVSILSPALEVECPAGGFFLWSKTPFDDQQFVRALFEHEHLTLLPGSFLSRQARGCNPGFQHARIALVPPLEECLQAAWRINRFVQKSTEYGVK
jgi:N-succinyldiaminopimelate aminotransferase